MRSEEQVKVSPVRQWSPLNTSRGLVLITGVIVVPLVLMLIFTSYNTVTVESALRQAFAGVAGQTVAILASFAAVAMTALSRRWRQLPLFALIMTLVCISAINSMIGTAEQLWWILRGLV